MCDPELASETSALTLQDAAEATAQLIMREYVRTPSKSRKEIAHAVYGIVEGPTASTPQPQHSL
jgi:hypothetical protein